MEDKIFIPAPPKELQQKRLQSSVGNAGEKDNSAFERQNIAAANMTEVPKEAIEKEQTSQPAKRGKIIDIIDTIINWAGLVVSLSLLCLFIYFLIK